MAKDDVCKIDESGKLSCPSDFKKEMFNAMTTFPATDFDLKKEAKAITAFAVRNSYLEDLHVDHFNDEEMKTLMKDVVNRTYFLLKLRQKSEEKYNNFLNVYGAMYTKKWDDPKLMKIEDIT
jgi:hypothetical protein